MATPLFRKFLRGHVRTVPGNMTIKYEVRSFNHFGVISIRHLSCQQSTSQAPIARFPPPQGQRSKSRGVIPARR